MCQLRNSAWRRLGPRFRLAGALCCCSVLVSSGFVGSLLALPAAPVPRNSNDNDKDKAASQPPTVRWDERQPGCTFSRGDDGKYHYGLWSGDVGIVMAVDAREVQIIRHRVEPIFGVLLTIRYRGAAKLDAGPDGITLQFMKHFKVEQPALDPDSYIQKIQDDADTFDDETRRSVARHPSEKQVRETRLQDYQKSANELIEFLTRNSLRAAHLDRANPEVSGWTFFDTKTNWLGGWKAQEEFLLRIPLDGRIFEFPFKLPPETGELLLQKRQ